MRRIALAATFAALAMVLPRALLAQEAEGETAPAQTEAPAPGPEPVPAPGWTAAPHAAMGPAPSARARGILRGRPYPFCHDARRRIPLRELHYCGYVDQRSACPEFARACDAFAAQRPPSCAQRNVGAGAAQSARAVFLALIIAVTAALLFFLVRAVLRARRTEALVDATPAPEERPSLVPVPAAHSNELFARALDAYQRGDYGAALYALYGSLLRKLDERGVIRVDPASTSGDYVRQCEPAELRAPLKETVREVEQVRFGGAAPTREAFDRLRARIEPIVRAAAALLLAFALAGGAVGCDDGQSGGGGGAESGPGGHRAVRELLTAEGVRARSLTQGPEEVQDVSRVLVIDGEATQLEAEQWTAVMNWVQRGGALVVAGGAARWPEALGLRSQARAGLGSEVRFNESFGGAALQVRSGGSAIVPGSGGFVVASSPTDDTPYAALVTRGEGRVLALSGAELVTNAGISVGANADATVSVFRAFATGRDVYFVEDPEIASSNPIRSLARAGLLPVVLQALLVVGLFYLMVGRHFATPRDRTTASRRAFAEHVRAVGGMYARARASGAVLRAYAQLVLDRLRERTHGAQGSLADAIAARVGEPKEEVERVIAAVERAREGATSPNAEAEDLRLVKRLNDWLKKLS